MIVEKEECGLETPLVQQPRPDDVLRSSECASIYGAIFNIATGMVGSGIMSIPASFKVLGVFPSFVVILIIAYFVEVTVEFMLKYTNSGESNTYGEMMAESFGKCGSVALQICVMITNLGALIIYLIIIGELF